MAIIEMREIVKQQWLNGTPESQICHGAKITRGELYRLLASEGIPLNRELKQEETKQPLALAQSSTSADQKHEPHKDQSTTPLSPSQVVSSKDIEYVRDYVVQLQGNAVIKIFPSIRQTSYRVSYNRDECDASFQRVTVDIDAGEKAEAVNSAVIQNVLGLPGTAIKIECAQGISDLPRIEWFDPEKNSAALSAFLQFVRIF